jgi:hypothetical protein
MVLTGTLPRVYRTLYNGFLKKGVMPTSYEITPVDVTISNLENWSKMLDKFRTVFY